MSSTVETGYVHDDQTDSTMSWEVVKPRWSWRYTVRVGIAIDEMGWSGIYKTYAIIKVRSLKLACAAAEAVAARLAADNVEGRPRRTSSGTRSAPPTPAP